jgi:4-hydroxy-tetrahydrodipicolinate synthase
MKALQGTGVALVTPFKSDLSIDFDGLEKLVNHVIDGGVEYLVVLGTTGEAATLSREEKKQVLAHVKKVNAGRSTLVYGWGGNNTQALLEELQEIDTEGVSALLSASPYYNKPSQEGIYQHYKSLAEKSPLPIILYNVPGRTASNLTAATTLRLARDFENIVAIKEASADMIQVMQIIKDKPKDFMVISGEDALTYPMITCGGVGVISVVANAYPKIYSDMVRAALKGDLEKGKELHYRLYDYIPLLFAEGNPAGVKSALQQMGICEDNLRLPLVKVSSGLHEKIGKAQKAIGDR